MKLTIDDIEVPEGIAEAAKQAFLSANPKYTWSAWGDDVERTVNAVLLHISNYPIVPSDEEARAVSKYIVGPSSHESYLQRCLAEWQRRMFLKKPPALPDAVKQLIEKPFDNSSFSAMFAERITAAYKLGLEERAK